jgi:hypothetical protein
MAAVRPLSDEPEPLVGSHSEFHSLRLGPHVFRGVVAADGPRIECGCNAVSLMHTGIAWFTPDDLTSPGFPAGWYVALDGTHPRIPLLDLTDAERERLAAEFGLPVAPWVVRRRALYGSPAFGRLAAWVAQHRDVLEARYPIKPHAASGAAIASSEDSAPEWLQHARTWHTSEHAVPRAGA